MSIQIIAVTENDDRVGEFIQREFTDYGLQNGVRLNYDEFCFAAQDEEQNILGVVAGRALYDEVHIQDLIVRKDCRKTGLGSRLVRQVEDAFKNRGYDVVTVSTYGFQAPDFYPRLGFKLDFVRASREPRLSKYFFSKKLSNG